MEPHRDALAMIHQGRSKEADELLAHEGVYRVRLSDQVFNYPSAGAAAGLPPPTCPVGVAYDGLLPRALVERLSFFLRDDAPFWTSHDYYSGKVRLCSERARARFSLSSLADGLL